MHKCKNVCEIWFLVIDSMPQMQCIKNEVESNPVYFFKFSVGWPELSFAHARWQPRPFSRARKFSCRSGGSQNISSYTHIHKGHWFARWHMSRWVNVCVCMCVCACLKQFHMKVWTQHRSHMISSTTNPLVREQVWFGRLSVITHTGVCLCERQDYLPPPSLWFLSEFSAFDGGFYQDFEQNKWHY